MNERRRNRVEPHADTGRFSAALDVAAARLTDLLGVTVRPSDAASFDAVQLALSAVADREASPPEPDHAWAERAEFLQVTERLAAALKGYRALLIWGDQPSSGFSVDLEMSLPTLATAIGPDPERPVGDGIGNDVLLVGDNGKSGLRLQYGQHHGADRYELRCWGRYAGAITAQRS